VYSVVRLCVAWLGGRNSRTALQLSRKLAKPNPRCTYRYIYRTIACTGIYYTVVSWMSPATESCDRVPIVTYYLLWPIKKILIHGIILIYICYHVAHHLQLNAARQAKRIYRDRHKAQRSPKVLISFLLHDVNMALGQHEGNDNKDAHNQKESNLQTQGTREDNASHGIGLYKRHHKAMPQSVAPLPSQFENDGHSPVDCPPTLTLERAPSPDSPSSDPLPKVRSPPPSPTRTRKLPQSPYRSTSNGNQTSSRVLERQKSSQGRSIGNMARIDSQLGTRNTGSEGARSKSNKLMFIFPVVAVFLSVYNMWFFLNQSNVVAFSRKSQRTTNSPLLTFRPSAVSIIADTTDTNFMPLPEESEDESNSELERPRQIESHPQIKVGEDDKLKTVPGNYPPRIAYVNNYDHFLSYAPKHRVIETYPSEFSDVTQLYPNYPSSDILHIESHDPLVNHLEGYGNCIPVNSTWQASFYPTCNSFHELDLERRLRMNAVDLFGVKGYWRHAWNVIDDDVLSGYLNQRFLNDFLYNPKNAKLGKRLTAFKVATMKRAGLMEDPLHLVLKTLR